MFFREVFGLGEGGGGDGDANGSAVDVCDGSLVPGVAGPVVSDYVGGLLVRALIGGDMEVDGLD